MPRAIPVPLRRVIVERHLAGAALPLIARELLVQCGRRHDVAPEAVEEILAEPSRPNLGPWD